MSKPRPPKIDREALTLTPRSPMTAFKNRFKQYEKELRSGELPKSFIAFEALSAILGARIEGYSDTEIFDSYPKEWGRDTIMLPVALVTEIAQRWLEYNEAPVGKTLGEVFKIEGGGQGKRRIRDIRKTSDKNRARAHAVEIEYLWAALECNPISEAKACELAAEKLGEKSDTVERAHKAHKSELREKLKARGILDKGGKRSRSSSRR